MTAPGARLTAIGTYVPHKRLTNADLEQMVETNDEWIVQRTGIRERRVSRPDEYTSDLCAAAVDDLITRYNKTVQDVDMVLVATSTPDFSFPSVAALLHRRFSISPTAGAYDISAACAGFVYGLHTAHSLIASGMHKKILVVAADTLSKIVDYTDRTTCVLFGDGAGAALIERDDDQPCMLAYHAGTDGSGAHHVYKTGLSSQIGELALLETPYLVQNGREVMRWAVRTVVAGMQATIEKAGLSSLAEVDWFIPHSANLRLIEPICERAHFPLEKTLYSLEYFGNTSAASIPLALDMGLREKRIRPGDRILLYGFGGGLTHAGQLMKIELDQAVAEPTPW